MGSLPHRNALAVRGPAPRQQTNPLHSCTAGDGNRIRNVLIVNAVISLNKGNPFCAPFENIDESVLQVSPRYFLVVDSEWRQLLIRSRTNFNDDSLDLRIGSVGGLRNLGSQPFFLNGRDCDHKDNDEYQKYVNHWRDVDIRFGRTAACC